jgi:hypothetical protein
MAFGVRSAVSVDKVDDARDAYDDDGRTEHRRGQAPVHPGD